MSDFVDEQIDADMSPELAPGAEIDARNVEEAASQEMPQVAAPMVNLFYGAPARYGIVAVVDPALIKASKLHGIAEKTRAV